MILLLFLRLMGKKARSGSLGDRLYKGQACFALGGGKAVVSGIRGQKHPTVLQKFRHKACILTQNSLLVALSYLQSPFCAPALQASGLVIMGEDNTNIFCEGLECTDLTE